MNIVKISTPRDYYVKLDNMLVPDDKKGYRMIQATSGFDLLEKSIHAFNLPHSHFQLVSSNLDKKAQQVRLDQLSIIPVEHEFILLRVRP